MDIELVVKIGIISALLFIVWAIYHNSGRKKADFMEQLLSETQKPKGQWDR